MKWFCVKIFLILFLPTVLPAQNVPSKNPNVTAAYTVLKGPALGIGVVGSTSHRGFASFVKEPFPTEKLIFNSVKFETVNFNAKKTSVLLCLYFNNNGLPGEIIPSGRLLIEIPAKKTLVSVNISKLNIAVPTEGYFFGFEWIPSKENEIDGTQTSNKPYNPTISGVTTSKPNLFTLQKIWKEAEEQIATELKFEVDYLPTSP